MFGRRKEKAPNGTEKFEPAFEPIKPAPRIYGLHREELALRQRDIPGLPARLAQVALERSAQEGRPITEPELPYLLAAAMNEGLIPKALLGTPTGAGQPVKLLDGQVPEDALKVHIARDDQGAIADVQVDLNTDRQPVEGENFSITDVTVPRVTQGDWADLDSLQLVDAHMPDAWRDENLYDKRPELRARGLIE